MLSTLVFVLIDKLPTYYDAAFCTLCISKYQRVKKMTCTTYYYVLVEAEKEKRKSKQEKVNKNPSYL